MSGDEEQYLRVSSSSSSSDESSSAAGSRGGTSQWGTWFSIVCTMAGTGILQLPYTLKQGGWATLGVLFLVGAMTRYTGKVLIQCLYDGASKRESLLSVEDARAERRPRLSGYAAIGEAAFGRAGKVLVHIFHKATLVGVCTLFLILAAKFLMEGIGGGGNDGFFPSLGDGSPESVTKWTRIWTGVSLAVVCVPVVFVKTLKEISLVAGIGATASMLTVLVTVILSMVLYPISSSSPVPFPDAFQNTSFTHVNHTTINFGNFPSAFSGIALSFGGHAVFPSIEEHMSSPRKFGKVFDFAYLALMASYLLVGCVGYATFGNLTYSPILCNLPRNTSTVMGTINTITKLIIAVHVLCAYPVLMNVVVNEIEGGAGIVSFLPRVAMRTLCLGVTGVVAIFVPFFPDVMELVGALCLTMIVFIFPVLFSLKLRSDVSALEKAWGVAICAVGIFGGGKGTYEAILNISHKLASGAVE